MREIVRPKKVKVGPHTYKIYYSKDSWRKYAANNGSLVGLCLVGTSQIFVKSWKLSDSQLKDTVLHEIIHACLALTMFSNQPVSLLDSKHDLEEFIILLLAPVMLQVIQDNPEIFLWLAQS